MQIFIRWVLVVVCVTGQAWADVAGQAVVQQGTPAPPVQPLEAVAQQTRQQAAFQATMDRIQADQTRVLETVLVARATRDGTIASGL